MVLKTTVSLAMGMLMVVEVRSAWSYYCRGLDDFERDCDA